MKIASTLPAAPPERVHFILCKAGRGHVITMILKRLWHRSILFFCIYSDCLSSDHGNIPDVVI